MNPIIEKLITLLPLLSMFLAFFTFTAYLLGIVSKYGVRKSILDSDYWTQKPWKGMFELTMTLCGASIIITGLLMKDNIIWMLVVGGAGIILVAVFSEFKKNLFIKIAHYVCAIGGFTHTGLSFLFSLNQWYFTLLIAIAVVLAYFIAKSNKLWYVEVVLSYLIFFGLFLNAAFSLHCI